MSVEALAPAIRAILDDPSTDLASVSAKRVRKQLVEGDQPATSSDFIRANKEAVDALISQIFERVSAERGGFGSPLPDQEPEPESVEWQNGTSSTKRKRSSHVNGYGDGGADEGSVFDDGDDGPSTPPVKKHKSKSSKSRSMTDEEFARQLSQELNSNPSRRTGAATTSKRGPSRTPKRVKKSRDIIDDDSDLDISGRDSDSGTKKKKAPRKSSGGGGFQKPLMLSPPLANVLLTDTLSRPQVVKKLWEYIRENNLQNPSNRRQIMCDTNLRAVFKLDKVDMFTMNKLLKDHLTPLDE